MRRCALVLMTLALSAGEAHAGDKVPGEWTYTSVGSLAGAYDGTIKPPTITLVTQWKLFSLIGEPVLMCRTVWMMPRSPVFQVGDESVKHIPAETIRRMRLFNLEVEVLVQDNGDYMLGCDPGVLSRPFIGSMDNWKSLSAAMQETYWSFNVPLGKSWGGLFHYRSGGWVGEDDAKRLAKDMVKGRTNVITIRGSGPAIIPMGLRTVEFDFANVGLLVAERQGKQKEKQQKTELATYDAKVAEVAKQQHEAQAQRAKPSFWDNPENPETVQEKKVREEVARERQKVVERQAQERQKIDALKQASLNQQARDQQVTQTRMSNLSLDRLCENLLSRVSACIYKACGSWPEPPLFSLACSGPNCPPEPTPQEKEENERRAAENLQRQREAWNACNTRNTPHCAILGISNQNQCSSRLPQLLQKDYGIRVPTK